MGFLTGLSLKSILLSVGVALLAGGGMYVYHYLSTKELHAELERKDQRLEEQAKEISALKIANDNLTKANTKLQSDFNAALEAKKINDKVIAEYQARIADYENEIRNEENQNEREALEASGQASVVLAADQAQIDCMNAHMGDVSGRCIKGKWVVNPPTPNTNGG